MLAIISTFVSYSVFYEFIEENFSYWNNESISFFVSISVSDDVDVNKKIHDIKRKINNLYVVCKKDNCYAEGWNNALNLFDELKAEKYKYLVFLGAGDAIKTLNIKALKVVDNSNVLVGKIIRNKRTYSKLPLLMLLPASVRAWTPCCLFPVDIFSCYRFPVSYKIANDVDLFFFLFAENFEFELTEFFVVDMETDGMSSNLIEGASEYLSLYESRFGNSILAKISFFLKFLKYKINVCYNNNA